MMLVRANEGVEEMVVVVLPLGAVVKAFADVSKRKRERIDFIFYQTIIYVALMDSRLCCCAIWMKYCFCVEMRCVIVMCHVKVDFQSVAKFHVAAGTSSFYKYVSLLL
jgi:hypothetical protein